MIRKSVLLALLVCVATISALAVDRIGPGELTYVGSFNLPAWRPGVRWGYGGYALTYDPNADALVGSAHVQYNGQIAWCSIPEIGERAVDLRPFADVRGSLISRDEFNSNPKLDSLGGLAIVDGRLWACFNTYYAVQTFAALDKPSFMNTSLSLDDPRGLYKPGPYGDPVYGQKRTSNYLFEIPKEWADAHVGGKRIGCGKGHGAGNAGNSHGPPIYAVSTEPDANGVLDAVVLVHYPPKEDAFPWSPCDQWEGAVWVRGTVLIAGRLGRGNPCYGTPAACNNGCESGKGYHCDPYGVDLLFYDEDDLALSASGDLPPHQVVPYARVDLTATLKDTCNYQVGGMAYDTRRSRVYLVQRYGENPLVHVWNVIRSEPPAPPPSTHRVRVTVDEREAVFEDSDRTKALARAVEYLAKELQ